MSKQDKHKIAAPLRTAVHKSKLLLSRKFLVLMPTAATLGILALVSVLFTSADTASNTYATSVNSEVTAEIDGTHYVTLSAPDVTFSITPTDSAQLSKQSINVNVETNATGGADLYLAMSGNTNALHLNGDTTSTAPAIEATAASVPASSLSANTWGYSTDDQTYSAVPTSDSDPALLAAVDGSSVGSNAGGVITASIPIYYAASVDTSIPAGSYANRMTYSAVVDGGIITSATLTKIEIDGAEVDTMQPEVENTLEVTTNLMTNTYGTPRVYLETTDPSGYQECGSVVVGRNESGYMTITCKVTPTQAATGVTLHIVPKGSSDDRFCTDGTYTPDTSDCEAGDWKWGSYTVTMPDIKTPPFGGVTTMQAMNTEICAAAAEGETTRLRDTRDDKVYWVGKLPDGNCWMTQNLDLDLSTNTVLTPADTNISANWTPSTSTTTTISGYSSDTGKSYDSARIKIVQNKQDHFEQILYDSHKKQEEIVMARRTQYSQQFKEDAVRYRQEHPGITLAQTAKNLGISESALKNWIKLSKENEGTVPTRGSGNYASDEAKEIARLQRELRDTKDALEVLKKAIGILGK